MLIVGNDTDLRLWRARLLSQSGFDVIVPTNKNAALAAIRAGNLDAILLCYSLSNSTVLQLAEEFRQHNNGGCIVAMMTGAYADARVQADVTLPATASPDQLVESIRTRCAMAARGPL